MGHQSVQPGQAAAAADQAYPWLRRIAEASDDPVYLVGGAVRDLLLGRERGDVDVVVEGDAGALARRLGGEVVEHERFRTAKAALEGVEVDLASARTESYQQPGSLPDVRPAGIEEDLGRRDFTINALALPLRGERELLDPHGGLADLDAGLLRVLHQGSFVDDPTRALRAARYAARFDFGLEPGTEALLRDADLATVSQDRTAAELRRIAAEPEAPQALRLLAEWELLRLEPENLDLAQRVAELLDYPPWSEVAKKEEALLALIDGPPARARELAAARPRRPSEAVEAARGASPAELALARALGGEWLDSYIGGWRDVELEISGGDLLDAGVPEGAGIGLGLEQALRRKLDGEIDGRDEELRVALEAARGTNG
jgi:tRNA nucleotidyltransferase (CCA-adding enzyme)